MSTTIPAEIPSTGNWEIDPVHSYAGFTVDHNVVATFRAGFTGVTGSLSDGVLSGSVPAANIELRGIEPFKQHLLSADWFDAETHPDLSFKSTDLHAHEDGSVAGAGELTIKGVTKAVSFSGAVRGPAEVTTADGSQSVRLGLNLTTKVDRREFGLNGTAGAKWEVTLQVSLQLKQA